MIDGKEFTVTQFVELYFETKDYMESYKEQNKKLKKELDELETELRVKEDLFKIRGAISEGQPSVEWYEERHQIDCITINQLHTTIDVLTDKLARLRGQMGL